MGHPKSRFDLENDEHEIEASEMAHDEDFQASDTDEDYASEERFESDKSRLIDFLQYPREKRKLADFIEETYKAYEQENVERTMNRVIHHHDVEMRGSTPFYKPGHIGPLMYEYLNMIGVESAFVSGLQHTKSSLTKTVQQRTDEINTLLRGVGGFNRQIKASFSRSAVIYLEQEDPRNQHRERVIFTVNLGDFELRYPLDENAEQTQVEDGRTIRRLVWDEAVNTLAEIVSNTGLKPKYVKNDKNKCCFTMRQHLLSDGQPLPDEYFTFDLRHVSEDQISVLTKEYVETIENFEVQIAQLEKKAKAWWLSAKKKAAIEDELRILKSDRDFYVGTNADPREMDTGLVFSIHVNTMKDYTVTKDKMQVIMTKYILALSSIATDKSMDQQVNTVYQRKQGKSRDFQNLDEDLDEGEAPRRQGKKVVVVKDELKNKKKKSAQRFIP